MDAFWNAVANQSIDSYFAESVREASDQALLVLINELKVCIMPSLDVDYREFVLTLFKQDTRTINADQVNDVGDAWKQLWFEINQQADGRKLAVAGAGSNAEQLQCRIELNDILETMTYIRDGLIAECRARTKILGNAAPRDPSLQCSRFRSVDMAAEQLSAYQNLLLFLLHQLYQGQYR